MSKKIFLWAIPLVLMACSDGKPAYENYPLEYKLAIVDMNGHVSQDDIVIKRFRYLIESLHSKTGYEPQKIADMVVKARNLINEEYGREVKIIDILEDANTAETVSSRAVKLEEYLGLYCVLVGQ